VCWTETPVDYSGTINNNDDGDSGNVTVMTIKDFHILLNFTQLPYFANSELILLIRSFQFTLHIV